MAKYERRKVEPSDWIVESRGINLAGYVRFPVAVNSTPQEASYFALGTEPTGSGKLLHVGSIAPSILIDVNVRPILGPGTSIPVVAAPAAAYLSLHTRHPLSGQDDGEVSYE